MSRSAPAAGSAHGAEPPGGSSPGLVVVARELVPLCGDAPRWPGGRETRFVAADEPLPGGYLARRVEAIIPLLSRPIGAAELDALPGLRIVSNYAVGYDNVDVAAAAERGIVVCNTPDVLTSATADLTWALILAAARRLREGLDLARSGDWAGWRPDELLGMGLEEKTLGILGAGRIGSAVARRAPGFGMRVVYWNLAPNEILEREIGARRADTLGEVLSVCDVLSVHLPLTADTDGLLGEAELVRLRPGAVLVNTARGEIVDTEALAAALRQGRLGAAGLDVYPDEPAIPAELRELPNAFVLPHLGSATREARRGMWELAAVNVRRVLEGRPPLTPVG